jgi:hypothetical protein
MIHKPNSMAKNTHLLPILTVPLLPLHGLVSGTNSKESQTSLTPAETLKSIPTHLLSGTDRINDIGIFDSKENTVQKNYPRTPLTPVIEPSFNQSSQFRTSEDTAAVTEIEDGQISSRQQTRERCTEKG